MVLAMMHDRRRVEFVHEIVFIEILLSQRLLLLAFIGPLKGI